MIEHNYNLLIGLSNAIGVIETKLTNKKYHDFHEKETLEKKSKTTLDF